MAHGSLPIPSAADPTSAPVERANPLALGSWVLYEWSSQPFYTLITTFLFSAYFVSGYVGDGSAWDELRLIVDGEVLAALDDASRIEAWWMLTPGEHRFWLEGQASGEGEVERTDPALVVVEEFEKDLVRSTP